MVAIDLGTAYLNIVPSTRDIAPGVKAALGDSSATGRAADNAGKSIGGRLSGALTKTLKVGALTAGGAIVGTLGTALYKGFGRLQGIEQAEAKLTGLGHSTKGVEKIMKNALNAVRGTAFGMDEAATTAAGAVAAGIKPGKDLQKTLTLVGDAATIAGTDMGSMGAIFNKVAASNKIQGDVIAQLNDAGIPIVQLLGKELGKTSEETLKLASEGKVNFETFQKAMQKGLGGAAQESGKTVSGSFANMQAALGRIGASLLGGAFEKLPGVLGGVTAKLDSIGPVATRVGGLVGKAMAAGIRAFQDLAKAVAPVVTALQAKLEPIARKVFDFFRKNPEVIKGAAIAFGALAGALGAVALAMGAVSLATSPITLIVLGVAALGAGIALLWKNSDGFREFVTQLGEGLLRFGGYLKDTVVPAVVDLASKVASNLQPVFAAVVDFFRNSVLPVVQQMLAKLREWGPTIGSVVGFVGGLVGKWIEFYTAVAGKVLPVVIRFVGFVIRSMGPAISGIAGSIGKGISALVSFGKAVYNAGVKVVDFAKKVANKIGDVVTWIGDLPGKAKSALGDLASFLVDSGKALIQGFINGMKSMVKPIEDAAKWVVGKVNDFVPWSPVKKGPLRKWNGGRPGKNLMDMLAGGIRKGTPGVVKAMEKVASEIDASLNKKKGGIGKKLGKQIKGIAAEISKAAQGLLDVLAQHADTVSSVASNLAGEFSLADIFDGEKNVFGLSAGGGAASVAAGIANRMRAFAEKLTALVSTGLPGTLISEIAGYGSVRGSEIADKFLKLSQADRASIRSSYDLFQSSTQGAGLAVANATHGGGISAAQASLEAAIENGFKGVGIYVDATVGVTDDVAVQILAKAEKRKKKRK